MDCTRYFQHREISIHFVSKFEKLQYKLALIIIEQIERLSADPLSALSPTCPLFESKSIGQSCPTRANSSRLLGGSQAHKPFLKFAICTLSPRLHIGDARLR